MTRALKCLASIFVLSSCAHLLTRDSRIPVGGRAEHEVVQHGGVRSDADTTAHHHRDLELVPVLIPAAERALYPYLRTLVLRTVVARIEVIAQLPRPRSLCLDVAGQKVLVRRRGQREGVKLVRPEDGAREAQPLSGQVLQVRRPVELDLYHVRGQQLRLDDVQGHVLGSQTDDLSQ